jgi:hypothetical protein
MQAEHDEEEEVKAEATDLPARTNIAHVEWSLDQSDIQGLDEEVGNSGKEKNFTEGSQEHDDGSQAPPSVEGSAEEVGDLVEEDWEGFSDPALMLFPVSMTMNQVSLIQLQCIVSITSTNIILGGLRQGLTFFHFITRHTILP